MSWVCGHVWCGNISRVTACNFKESISHVIPASIEATIGGGDLAFIEGCPYLRGKFELIKTLLDITMWPV